MPDELQILASSLRRDMRELAFRMAQFATEMAGMRDEVRDVKARLEDVIRLQMTKGDLDVIHFELDRFVDRMDALEARNGSA